MHNLKMPALQIRICGNAIIWLEVGDWVNIPRPTLSLSAAKLSSLGSRLCQAFWKHVQHAKGPTEFRVAEESTLEVVVTEEEFTCILRSLEAAQIELKNDPIGLKIVIAGAVDLEWVSRTVDLLRRMQRRQEPFG
jgi:hypothetical protein